MKKPVVLVTGTSSGIGLATAVQAALNGFTVVATMRDTKKSQPLLDAVTAAHVYVEVLEMDVVSQSSISACVSQVIETHGRLDAVINNAGAAHIGTIENESMEAIRAVMEVNYFGVVALTRIALPHLRSSRGCLITISSVGGVIGQPFNEAYCAAKFAVEGFMESLTPVARTVGVKVCVIEPGAVKSSFVANLGLDIPKMLAEAGPYAPAMLAYAKRTQAQFASSSAQTPEEVARIIVEVLTSDNVPARLQTSDWAKQFVSRKLADVDGMRVQELMNQWVC
jgi:NAD(P)-dependent dehydrogenase (short-subunit alcohol dehydrogenase family)